MTVGDGNEIVFLADRFATNTRDVIIHNVVSDKYTVLSDKENYNAIGVTPYKHCVFRCNNSYEKAKEEYISCDRKHFAIYTHGKNNTHSLRALRVPNNGGIDMRRLEDAMCVSLPNRNGMYLYN